MPDKMNDTTEQTRAAFEVYFRQSRSGYGRKKIERCLDRLADDTYADESTQRHWWTWQQSRAALSAAPPTSDGEPQTAEQVRRSGIYVACRECSNCGHAGINDESETEARCGVCGWCGQSPKEDRCPECGAENVMGAACPKCGGRYTLVADVTCNVPESAPPVCAQPSDEEVERLIANFEYAVLAKASRGIDVVQHRRAALLFHLRSRPAAAAMTDAQIDAAIEALFQNDNHYHAEWMAEVARPIARAVLAAQGQPSETGHSSVSTSGAASVVIAAGAAQVVTIPTQGLHALKYAVQMLREQGSYRDEEGDATNALEELLEALATPPAVTQDAMEAANRNGLAWAVSRWRAEVANRPLVNVHRRTLDDTWRQVVRYFGGDPDKLIGPSHDALLAASAPAPAPDGVSADAWTDWTAGDGSPAFEESDMVSVRTRGGKETGFELRPWEFSGWRHNGGPNDIIQYRINRSNAGVLAPDGGKPTDGGQHA